MMTKHSVKDYKRAPRVPSFWDQQAKYIFQKYCKRKINEGELNAEEIPELKSLTVLEITLRGYQNNIARGNEEYNNYRLDIYLELSKEIERLKNKLFN